MTKVNVSATLGMSTTVEEMSTTVKECLQQWGGNVHNSGGNVHNSGEIEYALRNLRLETVIHNSA